MVELAKIGAPAAIKTHFFSPFENKWSFFSTVSAPATPVGLGLFTALLTISFSVATLNHLVRFNFFNSAHYAGLAVLFLAATAALILAFVAATVLAAVSLTARSLATGLSYLGSSSDEGEKNGLNQSPSHQP